MNSAREAPIRISSAIAGTVFPRAVGIAQSQAKPLSSYGFIGPVPSPSPNP